MSVVVDNEVYDKEGNDGNDVDDVGGSVYGWFNACNLKMDSFERSQHLELC